MRPYEIVVIFDATLEERVIASVTERIASFVSERGGTPGHIERWGRRTFAYELQHRTEGYYVLIEVVAEPSVVAEVDRMLALSDDVLRHRVLRQPEHASAPRHKGAPIATEPEAATAAS